LLFDNDGFGIEEIVLEPLVV
jgi:hypothetical protein